jgi:hypothetical protein
MAFWVFHNKIYKPKISGPLGSFFNTLIDSLLSEDILKKNIDLYDRKAAYLGLEISDDALNSLKAEYIGCCKLPMLVKALD